MSVTTQIQRHRIFIRIRWFIYVQSGKRLLSMFTFYMTAPPIVTGEAPRLCVAELTLGNRRFVPFMFYGAIAIVLFCQKC